MQAWTGAGLPGWRGKSPWPRHPLLWNQTRCVDPVFCSPDCPQRHFPTFSDDEFGTRLFLKMPKKESSANGKEKWIWKHAKFLKWIKVGHYRSSALRGWKLPLTLLVMMETFLRALWVLSHLLFVMILICIFIIPIQQTRQIDINKTWPKSCCDVAEAEFKLRFSHPATSCIAQSGKGSVLYSFGSLLQPVWEKHGSLKHRWGMWCLMLLLTEHNRIWFKLRVTLWRIFFLNTILATCFFVVFYIF